MSNQPSRPTDSASWDQRYVDGTHPWDTGRPDAHLPAVLEAHGVRPGSALEIGCGTGTNAVWLARRGFQVTGVDLSPTAIARAKARAAGAGAEVRLLAADFLVDEVPGRPFAFVYDRGCFHVFRDVEERARFASRVHGLLDPGGIWHSLIGSTDGPPREVGPPRHSALDVASAVEPLFEILELRSTMFDDDGHSDARAWVLVARRRG